MLTWLAENWGTLVVLLAVLLVVGLVLAGMARDRKKGKSSCGGGCAGCPMCGSCHKK